MARDRDSNTLFARLGTYNPCWHLSGDSNALRLASSIEEAADEVVLLTAKQAARIRELTGVAAHVIMEVCMLGESLCLHLVGRKLDRNMWAGNAAAADDTAAVAHDLVHSLSFAEQVVSEVNSVVLIVDWRGRIRRFNRLAEEVTGLREVDIIGEGVGNIFARPGAETLSDKGIQLLLDQDAPDEIEMAIKTKYGERLFLFRNKLIKSSEGSDGRFLICAALTLPRNVLRSGGW